MKAENHTEVKLHRKVYRLWGAYDYIPIGVVHRLAFFLRDAGKFDLELIEVVGCEGMVKR